MCFEGISVEAFQVSLSGLIVLDQHPSIGLPSCVFSVTDRYDNTVSLRLWYISANLSSVRSMMTLSASEAKVSSEERYHSDWQLRGLTTFGFEIGLDVPLVSSLW